MTPSPRPLRSIVCEVCDKATHTHLQGRDVCRGCHRSEPRTQCSRCRLLKHAVSVSTGLCPRCASIAARPAGICVRCSAHTAIYDQAAQRCHACHKAMQTRDRNQVKRLKVACSVCGRLRSSALLGRAICQSCWRVERNGRAICAQCHVLKVIQIKAEHLCKQCYQDRLAPSALRAYLNGYTSPFPYNQVLLDLFLTTIDHKTVNNKIDRRIRALGRYLQTHEIQEPLTWEGIEAALPALGPTNRNAPKQIRASLLDIGHLLTAQGKLERREVYIERRNALKPLSQAPETIRPLLERYVAWLWERQTRGSNVRNHLEALAAFWTWSERRGLRSPSAIHTAVVTAYLLTLHWHWECSVCGGREEFDPDNRNGPQQCSQCDALHSLTQVRRYAQNTIRSHRARLLVFFDWCKIAKLVIVNPVQVAAPAPRPRVQHYTHDVLRDLCRYVSTPNADPTEAIVLYLILFHALSVWELRHVRIPRVHPLSPDAPVPTLAEAYYLIVPKPPPSVGDRSPGRPEVRLDFPTSASSWLWPLLDRFEGHRRQRVQNGANDYLLVSGASGRHNMPVGNVYVWEIVRRASVHVLGGACSPNTLRKSAGVLFADRAGAGILRWMGWDEQQAFAYTWAERETIHPRHADSHECARSDQDAVPVVFPAPCPTPPRPQE